MADAVSFGKFIEEKRKLRGFNMMDLASFLGVSQPYVSQIENGKRSIPSTDILYKLAFFLRVPLKEVLKEAARENDIDGIKSAQIWHLYSYFNSESINPNDYVFRYWIETYLKDFLISNNIEIPTSYYKLMNSAFLDAAFASFFDEFEDIKTRDGIIEVVHKARDKYLELLIAGNSAILERDSSYKANPPLHNLNEILEKGAHVSFNNQELSIDDCHRILEMMKLLIITRD